MWKSRYFNERVAVDEFERHLLTLRSAISELASRAICILDLQRDDLGLAPTLGRQIRMAVSVERSHNLLEINHATSAEIGRQIKLAW